MTNWELALRALFFLCLASVVSLSGCQCASNHPERVGPFNQATNLSERSEPRKLASNGSNGAIPEIGNNLATNMDVMRQRLVAMIRAENDPGTARDLEQLLNDPEKWDKLVRHHPLIRQLAIRVASGEDYQAKTRQLLSQLKEVITTSQLKAWAIQTLDDYNAGRISEFVSLTRVPKPIINLYTNHLPTVTIMPSDATAQSFVWVDWGGGWGHWGIMLGLDEFLPPEEGFYLVRLDLGIFVYHTSR